MPKQWYDDLEEFLTHNADRAKLISKYVHRTVPISVILGVVVASVIVVGWGWKEFLRMFLQVMLTLTLGATMVAGVIRRVEKKLEE